MGGFLLGWLYILVVGINFSPFTCMGSI